MIYKPDHFALYELLPVEFYHEHKGKEKVWFLFDPRILYTVDRIRKRYDKPMEINSWRWGGAIQYRGYRPPGTKVGSEFSQHKYGRGLDMMPEDITADEIREDIQREPDHEDFKYITCIEINISWLHIDCRNWNKAANGLFIVTP